MYESVSVAASALRKQRRTALSKLLKETHDLCSTYDVKLRNLVNEHGAASNRIGVRRWFLLWSFLHKIHKEIYTMIMRCKTCSARTI